MSLRIPLPRILCLILGLSLYTAIGMMFIVPWLPIRLLIFLVVLLAVGKGAFQPIIWGIAGIFGLMFGIIDDNFTIVTGIISWIAITGSMFGAAAAYNNVFQGADFAAVAIFFPKQMKTSVALTGYYVFKIIPDLRASLSRVAEAEYIYGSRNMHTGASRVFSLLIQTLVTYLLEALALPFSNQRIMDRRRSVVVKAIAKPKFVEVRIFLLMILVPAIELLAWIWYI